MLASVAPADTCYELAIFWWNFAEFLYLWCAGAPNVYSSVQADSKDVLWAPIHQIQVKIIFKLGCVKHLERHFVYLAKLILSLLSIVIEIHIIFLLIIAVAMLHFKWIVELIIHWLGLMVLRISQYVFIESQDTLRWLCLKASWRVVVLVPSSCDVSEAAYPAENSGGLVKIIIKGWRVRSSHSQFCPKQVRFTAKLPKDRVWQIFILWLHSEDFLTQALLREQVFVYLFVFLLIGASLATLTFRWCWWAAAFWLAIIKAAWTLWWQHSSILAFSFLCMTDS